MRDAKQQVVYILKDGHVSNKAHSLGVNAFAIDAEQELLYSAGRDGIICAWEIRNGPGRFRQAVQAHTNWVNDIAVCGSNRMYYVCALYALVISASCDQTVKLTNFHSGTASVTLGKHADYVKCLAYASGPQWVASGGLDRRVYLWDVRETRHHHPLRTCGLLN
jgi:WD repeat-containing protein 48